LALSTIFLAVTVGLTVAGYAFTTGTTGLMGAIGLYIAAGWAAIVAVISSRWIVGLIHRRMSHQANDAATADFAMADSAERHNSLR
jgi:hypothetical protein